MTVACVWVGAVIEKVKMGYIQIERLKNGEKITEGLSQDQEHMTCYNDINDWSIPARVTRWPSA